MSTDDNRARDVNVGFQLLSKEERQLRAKIRNEYFFLNFLPMWLCSCTALKFFIQKGKVNVKRPGLAYFGLTMLTYMTSKGLEFRTLVREMKEKYPDGIFAQTSHMNREQIIEYIKKKEVEDARMKLEAAGMSVVEKTGPIPDQLQQYSSDMNENQSNLDTSDVGQQQETSQEQKSPRKTYADLRSQSKQDRLGGQDTFPRPLQEPTGKETLSDDPPSKLRTGKKNRYGDEIE